MTNLLHLGDYCPDGKGGIARAEGNWALMNEVLLRLTCRRGSFPLLPELGSRLYLLSREKPSARDMAARQYAAEALAPLDVTVTDAKVTMMENDAASVRVTLSCDGQEMMIEVET